MNQVDYDSRHAVGRPVNARPDHADVVQLVVDCPHLTEQTAIDSLATARQDLANQDFTEVKCLPPADLIHLQLQAAQAGQDLAAAREDAADAAKLVTSARRDLDAAKRWAQTTQRWASVAAGLFADAKIRHQAEVRNG